MSENVKTNGVKVLYCQYPIVKETDVKCQKIAVKYDRWGWAYCEEHAPSDCYNIRDKS